MKKIHQIIVIGAFWCAALTAGSSALAQDMNACRGGYPVMLMTPAECQAYLRQLGEVRAHSDRMAELDLREWHSALLIQRAEVCPCVEGRPILLTQRTTGILQNQKTSTRGDPN